MAYGYRSRRTRSPSRRRGSSRRSNVWVRQSGSNTNTAVFASDLLSGSIDPGAVVGSTVVRVRGSVDFGLNTTSPTVGGIYLGIAVTEREPTPLTPLIKPFEDMNSVQWMYWEYISVASRAQGVSGNLTNGGSFNVAFDVKASRRIPSPSMTLNLFTQPVSVVPAGFTVTTSVLLKV